MLVCILGDERGARILFSDGVRVTSCLNLYLPSDHFDLAAGVRAFPLLAIGRVAPVQLTLELNSMLHAFNNETQVKSRCRLRQDLIEVQLGDAAELLREKLRHLPLFRKQVKCGICTRGGLFEDAFKPREASPGVLERRVGLSWGKRLLVRLQELAAKLNAQLVYCTLSNCVQGKASLVELLLLAAFADAAKVFQNL